MTNALITSIVVAAAGALIIGSIVTLKESIARLFQISQDKLDDRMDTITASLDKLSDELSGLNREHKRMSERVLSLEEWRKYEDERRKSKAGAA